MLSHRSLLALAVPLALAATAPPALAAKHAVFNVSVKGSQATTWHMETPPDPQLCGAAQHADGDQMIRFASPKPVRVVVTQNAGGRPSFSIAPTVDASVQRSADFQMDGVLGGRTGCTGIVHLPAYHQPGCGERKGSISVSLGYSSGAGDDELAPLVPEQNHLRLRGTDPNFGGAPLLTSYPTCPMLIDTMSRPETRGELLEVIEPLRESRLFAKKQKVIKVSAGRVEDMKAGNVTGRTAIAYNVTLKRVH